MPAGNSTGTARLTSDLLALTADSQAAHSTNRQLLRDFIMSFEPVDIDIRDWTSFTGDGSNDDTPAVKSAITQIPTGGGGNVIIPRNKKVRITSHISDEINGKGCVRIIGGNPRGFEGIGAAHNNMLTTFYLKDLTVPLYTKAGTGNDILALEGIYFDGANGGLYSSSTSCPGVIYSADLFMYYLSMERCMFRNLGYAHTNTTGQRAAVDAVCVWNFIEKCHFGKIPNGRAIRLTGTHSKIHATEFTECREIGDVQVDNLIFDWCGFESSAFAISQLGGSVKYLDCWAENLGYSADTTYTTGISQRNRGLAFASGALNPSGGIITPFHQLYGSAEFVRMHYNSFAPATGHNTVPASWHEALGQANSTDSRVGGSLHVSGVKQQPQALFSATMLPTAAERGALFHVSAIDDGWQATSGSSGASLFNSTAKDYRKVTWGRGRIYSADSTFIQYADIRGGRLVFDTMDYPSAITGPPGPTQYPQGDQYEIGDEFKWPGPIAGGYRGVVCTAPGTAAPGWSFNNPVVIEGTFAPTLTFGGASAGMTFSVPFAGRYVKIGRTVHFTLFGILSNKGSSVGVALINGLPFVNANVDSAYTACAIRLDTVSFTGQFQAFIQKNNNQILLERIAEGSGLPGGGVLPVALNDTNFANTSNVMISGTYET